MKSFNECVWTYDMRNGTVLAVVIGNELVFALANSGRSVDKIDIEDLLDGYVVENCRLVATHYGLWRREHHIRVRIRPPKSHPGGAVARAACTLQIESPGAQRRMPWPVDHMEWRSAFLTYYSMVLDVANLPDNIVPKRVRKKR